MLTGAVDAGSFLRSSVRRLLSGQGDGEPDYVRELSLPGDIGLFGPDSVVWRVHGDVAMLPGGVRALLLQALDPLTLAGVVEHSRFREDPLGRLQQTARFVTVVSFASTGVAAAECQMVRAVHERVRGVAPDGRTYAASDPLRLRHVHLSLVDSFLTCFQLFAGSPLSGSEADRYVVEMNRLAPLLGFDDVPLPTSVAELRALLLPSAAGLAVSADTLTVLGFLASPPLSFGQLAGYRFLHRAALASLPGEVRALVPSAPRGVRARLQVEQARPLLQVLRRSLGESPALRRASARVT